MNVIMVHVCMLPEVLNKIDGWVKLTRSTRSEFIRQAVKHYIQSLERRKKW